MSKQREALQMALDALSSDSPDIMLRASVAIRKALAELEPEPVGIVRTVGGYPDDSKHTVEWLVKHKDLHDGDKLYAAPAARKPLTDAEISDLWDGHVVPAFGKNGINPIVFARAIEKAHGIIK